MHHRCLRGRGSTQCIRASRNVVHRGSARHGAVATDAGSGHRSVAWERRLAGLVVECELDGNALTVERDRMGGRPGAEFADVNRIDQPDGCECSGSRRIAHDGHRRRHNPGVQGYFRRWAPGCLRLPLAPLVQRGAVAFGGVFRIQRLPGDQGRAGVQRDGHRARVIIAASCLVTSKFDGEAHKACRVGVKP
jgi:hypothetical protein